jgi:cytochrome c551/c552
MNGPMNLHRLVKGLLLSALLCIQQVIAADTGAGKVLFETRCKSCHGIHDKVVGPALKDIDKKYDDAWLSSFIRSSQSMIKSGDPRAVEVFAANNKIVMPDHTDFTDEDMVSVLAFIKESSAVAAVIPEKLSVVKVAARPLAFLDFREWMLYSFGVVILFFTLFAIVSAKSAIGS